MSLKNYSDYSIAFTHLVDGSTDKFTESAATGDEFYYATDVKHKPLVVLENGTAMTEGTLGSLAAGEWAWGDNDTLGYSTIYVKLSAPANWAASTAYVVGDFVKDTTSGNFYECTTAGTSGASEPTWDTTIGNTTTDNTATWTRRDNYEPDDRADGYIKASLALTLIDVTASHSVGIFSIEMCSRESADTKNIRIIRTTSADAEFFRSDIGIPFSDTVILDHGLSLAATEKLKVMCDSENIAIVINANDITNP